MDRLCRKVPFQAKTESSQKMQLHAATILNRAIYDECFGEQRGGPTVISVTEPLEKEWLSHARQTCERLLLLFVGDDTVARCACTSTTRARGEAQHALMCVLTLCEAQPHSNKCASQFFYDHQLGSGATATDDRALTLRGPPFRRSKIGLCDQALRHAFGNMLHARLVVRCFALAVPHVWGSVLCCHDALAFGKRQCANDCW